MLTLSHTPSDLSYEQQTNWNIQNVDGKLSLLEMVLKHILKSYLLVYQLQTANLSTQNCVCWRVLQQWVDGWRFILLWTERCSNCQHDTTAYGMYSELFYFIYLFIMFVVVMFFRCECLFKIAEFWFHKN